MTARVARLPPLNETEFLRQVLDLATLLGWHAAHFRPARTARGWRTPVQGSLGAGFPDLVLVRVRDQRLVLCELKSDTGKLSPRQVEVHDILRAAGRDVRVWRPNQWDEIAEVLR